MDSGEALEQALRDGAPLDEVLDVADEAIETAAANGDGALLAWLAEELAAAAAERGGDWNRLAIAGARARALVSRADPTAEPEQEPGPKAQPVVPAAAPVAPESSGSPLPYAGWWRRAAALGVDCIVVATLYAFFGAVRGDGDSWPYLLLELGIPLVYFAAMHAFVHGATVGKAALGVAVRTADGRGVGLGRATARAVVTFLLWSTLLGGLADLIVGAAARDRRWLHDMIVGTAVVRTRA